MTDKKNDALREAVTASLDSVAHVWRNADDCEAWDVLDCLEVRYTVDATGRVLCVHLLTAFGGPSIWVDIDPDGRLAARGYWWSDSLTLHSETERPDVFDYFADSATFGGAR